MAETFEDKLNEIKEAGGIRKYIELTCPTWTYNGPRDLAERKVDIIEEVCRTKKQSEYEYLTANPSELFTLMEILGVSERSYQSRTGTRRGASVD